MKVVVGNVCVTDSELSLSLTFLPSTSYQQGLTYPKDDRVCCRVLSGVWSLAFFYQLDCRWEVNAIPRPSCSFQFLKWKQEYWTELNFEEENRN